MSPFGRFSGIYENIVNFRLEKGDLEVMSTLTRNGQWEEIQSAYPVRF
jgi:hypothetical protein